MRKYRKAALALALLLLPLNFYPALAQNDVIETETPSQPFAGCALIGDSISDGLRIYAVRRRKTEPAFLGGLEFLTATGYNLKYAVSSKPRKITYHGESMRPQDALNAMNADTVFIMLGMNDIFRDFADSIERYETLIGNIRTENPGINICILGLTPVVYGKERSGFTNERIDRFNELLAGMATNLHCRYICFSSELRDENGGLQTAYSNDQFVHLKGDAFEIYAAALESILEIIHKHAALPDTFSCLTADFQSLT